MFITSKELTFSNKYLHFCYISFFLRHRAFLAPKYYTRNGRNLPTRYAFLTRHPWESYALGLFGLWQLFSAARTVYDAYTTSADVRDNINLTDSWSILFVLYMLGVQLLSTAGSRSMLARYRAAQTGQHHVVLDEKTPLTPSQLEQADAPADAANDVEQPLVRCSWRARCKAWAARKRAEARRHKPTAQGILWGLQLSCYTRALLLTVMGSAANAMVSLGGVGADVLDSRVSSVPMYLAASAVYLVGFGPSVRRALRWARNEVDFDAPMRG